MIVKMRDIHKTYKTGEKPFYALKGIDLEIEEGEFLSILGKSGSGKSTLLHIMGLLDDFDRGHYTLLGRDVSKMDDNEKSEIRGKSIGFVFQFFYLLPSFNALENVMVPMLIRNMDEEEARERAKELLDKVGLREKYYNLPSQLSGGEQQRVAIARALALNPVLLLADEPTGNLDVKSEEKIMEIFKKINDEGTTIVIVTHEREIAEVSERIIFIKDGKIEKEVRK